MIFRSFDQLSDHSDVFSLGSSLSDRDLVSFAARKVCGDPETAQLQARRFCPSAGWGSSVLAEINCQRRLASVGWRSRQDWGAAGGLQLRLFLAVHR